MVEIPAAIVYVGTAALVLVCGFLAVLLYFLIRLTRVTIVIAQSIQKWEGRIEEKIEKTGRMLRMFGALFRSE